MDDGRRSLTGSDGRRFLTGGDDLSLLQHQGLQDNSNVTVEESVAMFLLVLGHGVKLRVLGGIYIRSLETISRRVHEILRLVLSLSKDFIRLPNQVENVDENDHKWRWFKDCLGALDRTHVEMTIPLKDQGRYRNRKQQITTNVLGVCDRKSLKFHVLPGWEGSSSNSKVIRSALVRERDPFLVPTGNYYLVDAGYANTPGYLAPYHSTRYHLNEWSSHDNRPSNYKELFNLRHSLARNSVERTFGLLKNDGQYFINHHFLVCIINACCVLHNYIREIESELDYPLLHEVDCDLAQQSNNVFDVDYEDVITNVQGGIQ
ncbi:protein ALP1-like [Impatiens glandulifera]|uniref:protein ALP1-like n=1 Tax=Impatiens glandulifera TaxID=253017 RepID=UPI001FB070AE|nr:protein ALP1-like [Impatiens glandulifera]